MNLKVIVVDDTIVFRSVVADACRAIAGVEVIGTASSGRTALARIAELGPDLITLDIEMPGMNGLEVLDEIKKRGLPVGVIIVSSFTTLGSGHTIRALEKGAFDFITKPSEGTTEENRKAVIDALTPRIKAFARKWEIATILRGKNPNPPPPVPAKHPLRETDLTSIASNMGRIAFGQKPEMVLIGVSTGGPQALTTLLPSIPGNIGVPILIVQHMPPLFTKALAESLNSKCALKVREATNNEPVEPGTVYIAPGGKQMKICVSGDKKTVVITDDPPENNCKPSVDYLFRSASQVLPGKCLAAIMTGMGSDGTMGLRLLKRNGCFVLAQDEASCVVYGMPKAAVDAGVVDEILPLERIAGRITESVRKV
jgi:two-component system chemotaxis response regulator CheB